MQSSNRVLVIGLDGATWDVLSPWMREGILPNLSRLRQRGCWGALLSSIPPITAAAWSTFMTGKRPGKHGVYHFVNLFDDDGEGDPELVSARSLKSPALWDVLAHHDRRVVLVNIPLTYPPRPVNGAMITGLLTPSSAEVFTYPPELSKEIPADYQIDLERFIDKTPHVDTFDPAITAPTLDLVREFRDMEEQRAEVCFSLMSREPWDFFMVVFTATDRMGHYLWPFQRSPRPDDRPEIRQLCQAVRDFYVRLDEIVGELVAQAGADAAVIIMSDHGMGPTFTRRFHCNNWLRRHGWLAAKSSGSGLATPDDWLKRLGLPRDKIGRLVRSVPGLSRSRIVKQAANSRAAAVDIERSKAYCVPLFYNIMGVRIRLAGPTKEALCQQIIHGLQQIVDPETGQPVVQRAFRASEYYDGPHADNIPDIIAILDPDYGCNFHLSTYSSDVTRRVEISGPAKHRTEGILIATGPGIVAEPEPLPHLQIEDVAPTVLHLMDVPVPSDMDGRVLAEVIEPALIAEHPVRKGEPLGFWPEEGEAVFSEAVMTDKDEEVIRSRLRALGYFE